MADFIIDVTRVILRKVFCLLLDSTCSTLRAIVVPKAFGATYTAQNLEDSKGMVIDLVEAVNLSLTQEQTDRLQKAKDSGAQTTFNSIYYPICKTYVQSLRQSFKNKRLTFIASDHRLLKYCGVKDLSYFVPSSNFLQQVVERIADPQSKELVRRSVVDLLTDKGQKSLVFSSFEELSAMLKDLDLKSKI